MAQLSKSDNIVDRARLYAVDNSAAATTLLDPALAWLRSRLPAAEIRIEEEPTLVDRRGDAILTITANSFSCRVLVELRTEVTPRSVAELTAGPFRRMRTAVYNLPVLVVAPFLSRQAQAALRAEDLWYLDLTGNALIKLETPAIYIETQGATTNPQRSSRRSGRVTLRGSGAGRLLRTILDVTPPYSVSELARASALDPGNVSRTLDTLNDYGVVTRAARGRVTETDIAGLLRLWAETYAVMRSNRPSLYVSPNGPRRSLSKLSGNESVRVTGSFAAVEIARVAAPAQLMIYATDPATVAEDLGLLATNESADVVLLEPFDTVVWNRPRTIDEVRYVPISQAAIDCLTGPGRMPAEGNAIIDWMTKNENQWRLASTGDLGTVKMRTEPS